MKAQISGANGSGELHFALDTGAIGTTINTGLLTRLGYDPAGSTNRMPVITASGVTLAPIVVVSRILSLGHERLNFPVLSLTLPAGAGIDGVLGLDFLRGLVVTLDFRAGQITIA